MSPHYQITFWFYEYTKLYIFLLLHLFTHKEGHMTPVTIGYKTIDNFHEKCILQNWFRKVSSHILSFMVYSLK